MPSLVTVLLTVLPMASVPSTLTAPVGELVKLKTLSDEPEALAGTSKVPALVNAVEAVLSSSWPEFKAMAPLLVKVTVGSSVAPESVVRV